MSAPERPLVSRLFPQAESAVSDLSSGRLPADMEESAARRLGALALVVSVVAVTLGTIAQFAGGRAALGPRSEEHTSELQSRRDLVCRLLLEKKMLTSRTTCF